MHLAYILSPSTEPIGSMLIPGFTRWVQLLSDIARGFIVNDAARKLLCRLHLQRLVMFHLCEVCAFVGELQSSYLGVG